MLAANQGLYNGFLAAGLLWTVACGLGVILVRDRRAEERHDAVARVLVHRALEPVHALGEDREEAVEDLVPLLGIDLLGQLHRPLHVGEEDGHLLALALERGARREYLLGEVLRGVRARVRCGGPRRLAHGLTTDVTELGGRPELSPAVPTGDSEARAATVAEGCSRSVLAAAEWAA